MGTYVEFYLLAVNLLACFMYWLDKQKAKQGKWRISEAALLTVAAAGGSAGAWLSMKLFRHKTKHPKFAVGVPLLLMAQAVVLMYLYF